MVGVILSRRSYTTLALLALTGRHTHAFTLPYAFRRRGSSLKMSSTGDAKKRVLVPIADGSEEIETTCLTDTLVRFGADVTVASVMPSGLLCTMSRGIKVRSYKVLITCSGRCDDILMNVSYRTSLKDHG